MKNLAIKRGSRLVLVFAVFLLIAGCGSAPLSPTDMALAGGNRIAVMEQLRSMGSPQAEKDRLFWKSIGYLGVYGDRYLEVTKALLDDGANPYATFGGDNGYKAVVVNNVNALKLLNQYRFDLNTRDPKDGETLMYHAVLSGKHESIKFLISNGANPDIKDRSGDAPLHTAVQYWTSSTPYGIRSRADINKIGEISTKLLIAAGADVNAISARGLTPLYWAALENRQDVMRYLLSVGANPEIKSSDGISVASQLQHSQNLDEQQRIKRQQAIADGKNSVFSRETLMGLVAMVNVAAENYAADSAQRPVTTPGISHLLADVPTNSASRAQPAPPPAGRVAVQTQTAQPLNRPQYQPPVVTIPKGRETCPPGSSPARQANGQYVTIPPAAYCIKDPQSASGQQTAQGADRNGGVGGVGGVGGADGSAGQETANNTRSDQPRPTAPARQPARIEWGPVQMEAFAICSKGEKSGKWWCDGPLQEASGNASVEEGLRYVGCSPATAAAGATTKDGKPAELYRCGFGLRSYDRNIAKIHGVVTAPRSYMCRKNFLSKCTDFYDGQDKR